MEITNSIKWLIVIVVLMIVRLVVVAANPTSPSEKPGLQGMLADSYKAKQKAEIEAAMLQMTGILDACDTNNLPITGNPADDLSMYLDRMKTFQNVGRRVNYSRCPADFRKAMKELLQIFDKMANCGERMKMTVDEIMATSNAEARLALQPKVFGMQKEFNQVMADLDAVVARLETICKQYGVDDVALMNQYREEQAKKGKTVNITTGFSSKNGISPSTQTVQVAQNDTELINYMQPVYDGVCLRLAKLLELAGGADKSPEILKSGAKKTKEFAANYRTSSFPKDFLSVLERVEDQMETYANWQTEQQNEEDVDFVTEIDKAHLDEMKQLIKDLNKVASQYGCETSAAP